jgi:hypothetical protein
VALVVKEALGISKEVLVVWPFTLAAVSGRITAMAVT